LEKEVLQMRRIRWGIVLVIIGLWIWFSHMGIPFLSFGRDWPIILIIWGIWVIIKTIRKSVGSQRIKVTINETSEVEESKDGGKSVKIHVTEKGSGKTKTNIRIPAGLVKFGVNFIPSDAKINISEEKIDIEKIIDAIENNKIGKILEIDNGTDIVEISIE
jgi:hypothetical protein